MGKGEYRKTQTPLDIYVFRKINEISSIVFRRFLEEGSRLGGKVRRILRLFATIVVVIYIFARESEEGWSGSNLGISGS